MVEISWLAFYLLLHLLLATLLLPVFLLAGRSRLKHQPAAMFRALANRSRTAHRHANVSASTLGARPTIDAMVSGQRQSCVRTTHCADSVQCERPFRGCCPPSAMAADLSGHLFNSSGVLALAYSSAWYRDPCNEIVGRLFSSPAFTPGSDLDPDKTIVVSSSPLAASHYPQRDAGWDTPATNPVACRLSARYCHRSNLAAWLITNCVTSNIRTYAVTCCSKSLAACFGGAQPGAWSLIN